MKCRVCGADIPEDAYFCGECGALVTPDASFSSEPPKTGDNNGQQAGAVPPLAPPEAPPVTPPPLFKCGNCGGFINQEDEFCQHCGEPVNNIVPPIIQPAPPRNQNKGVIIAAVAIYILIMIVVGAIVINIFVNKNDVNLADSSDTSSHGAATLAPASTTQPTAIPTAVPTAVAPTGDFLFPSDTQYITEADLAGKSQDEVRLILNEIYARRGYSFSTDYYRNYFSSKSWYTPRTSSQPDVEKSFNAVELANKNFIAAYEQSRGWR